LGFHYNAKIVIGLGQIRLDFYGLAEILYRLLPAAKLAVNNATIIVRFGVIGIDFEYLFIMFNSESWIALLI
jgi:hypothetical protein